MKKKYKKKYLVTLLNIDGSPLWHHENWQDDDCDFYRPLIGDETSVRCTIDSPQQEDKRATYSLLIERVR